jgi:hypothetical protein
VSLARPYLHDAEADADKLKSQKLVVVAVGMSTTAHPPQRSVRAELPHTVPPLDTSVEALIGIRMKGSVASAKVRAWNGISSLRPSSHGYAEDVFDQHDLAGDIAFRNPPHLSFPDHIHRFDSLKG